MRVFRVKKLICLLERINLAGRATTQLNIPFKSILGRIRWSRSQIDWLDGLTLDVDFAVNDSRR